MRGRVVKGVASSFLVEAESQTYRCAARGKLKLDGQIYIGDFVEFESGKGGGIITKVLTRKNSLIRPYVANIDVAFIVVAPLPKPDYLLVDKIIVNALKCGIEPIIVANKSDIGDPSFENEVNDNYKSVAKIVFCSAKDNSGVLKLLELSKDKVACLAGQSAVGKSSILNALLGMQRFETGEMSKISRGRHTTRQSELIKIEDSFIIDTCGFSMLELEIGFDPIELQKYYDDFFELGKECKFRGCTHTSEPNCMVKQTVADGKLCKARYDRYKQLYDELNDKWRKRYD